MNGAVRSRAKQPARSLFPCGLGVLLCLALPSGHVFSADHPPSRNVDVAASGGPYRLDWHSIDAGTPQTSSSATFRVRGSVGQPDVDRLSGGDFRIDGGFWASAAAAADVTLFFDGFEARP